MRGGVIDDEAILRERNVLKRLLRRLTPRNDILFMPPHPQTILGIDPGFGRMGFGAISLDHGIVRLIDYGVITTKSTDTFDERLVQIAEDIRALLKEHKPDLIGIEKLFFGKSSTTAMYVSEVRGVVRLLCAEARVPIVEFTPAQIKKTTTGDGKANKQGMQKMVQHLLGLKLIPKPDDAADALAVALTAVGSTNRALAKKTRII